MRAGHLSSARARTARAVADFRKLENYGREQRHPSGAEWNRKKANVIAANGGICYLCDHPNAKQIDHLVVSYPLDNSLPNLRPAHGSSRRNQQNRCPVCGLNCNQVRGSLTVEAGRAKIARRIAQGVTVPVNEPEHRDEGREW